MSRRGGGGARAAPARPTFKSPPSRGQATAAPARPPSPPPPPPQKVVVVEQGRGKQPGLFAQSAAIAGGVAAGTAIGHTVGSAVTGMLSGPPERAREMYPEEPSGPCAWEIKQFLKCAEQQPDLSYCQAFNDAIKSCKVRHNIE